VTSGTDRATDAQTGEITLNTVANPRRTRVDAEGRPLPATQRTGQN
jgi:type IV secretory pathway protease TraF